MIIERCIQNIIEILENNESEKGRQPISQDHIATWFMQNKDEKINISIASHSSLELKAMLWNLDNLKAPVRRKLELHLLSRISNDAVVESPADDSVSEEPEIRPVIDEKKPVAFIEQSVTAETAESGIDEIQNTPAIKEDLFDKMLNIVSVVVRALMFRAS